MQTETLTCEEGHEWTREVKRGKKPALCPEHRAEREAQREAERPQTIAENVNTRMIERIQTALDTVVPHTDLALGVEIVHPDREVLEAVKSRLTPEVMERRAKKEDGVTPESVDHILSVARERLRPYSGGTR